MSQQPCPGAPAARYLAGPVGCIHRILTYTFVYTKKPTGGKTAGNNSVDITSVSMRHIPINIASCIILSVLSFWTSPAHAVNALYPLITYTCDSEANILTITHSLLKGEKGAKFEYSAEDGTYSPWNMVEIARNTDSTRIIKSTKVTNTCKLSSAEYTVVLEPHIFSMDLESQCGESISGAVTITADGVELLERTAFEDFCYGNAPIITRITVFGKTGEYKIKRIAKYKFY